MNSEEEICVVCCREIVYYATGQCDHHVCYECSTRMRVLCEQNECPICRSDMPYVIFTRKKKLFSSVEEFTLRNRKYTIAFEDQEIQDAFKTLLEHRCKTCGDSFNIFDELKSHVQRNHTSFFCELCVQNLKIFTFERKCYSRKDLAHHKRKGDLDETSHRGHPLCEFCDKRFVDSDELYRHLRREHYFCHFCDADGIQNGHFYHTYLFLNVHFRKNHYLCEEGDCAKEQFVGAFRTEIDFKAHKALNHTKNKTKAEVIQARTLDLEFSITPRESSPNQNRRGRHGGQNDYHKIRTADDQMTRDTSSQSQATKQSQNKTFNTQCVQDFPLLANGTVPTVGEHLLEKSRYSRCISNDFYVPGRQDRMNMSPKKMQAEDFPALSPTSNQKSSNQGMKRAVKTSASDVLSQRLRTSNSSGQIGVDKSQTATNWRKSSSAQENADKEKSKVQNATWGLTRKNVTTLEEEFPRLETKKTVTVEKVLPQGEWRKPEKQSLKPNDSLAKQIYQKCKTKKKQKNQIVEVSENSTSSLDETEPPALSKIYSGFSNHNVMGNDENEDPFKNLSLKVHSKIDRFRRELEVDDVPWRENSQLVEDDFPPLEPLVTTSKCPPGFNATSATNAIAPPGFQKPKSTNSLNSCMSLSSIAQQLNDCQTTKLENEKTYLYQPPCDFQERNSRLIQRIFELASSDNILFYEFRSLSGDFRKNKISASDYHLNCMRILGKEKFFQLFTELLCLLPDITKQQELLTVHNSFLKEESKNKGAVPKQKVTKINYSNSLITVCKVCEQVLIKSDVDSHMEYHKNM